MRRENVGGIEYLLGDQIPKHRRQRPQRNDTPPARDARCPTKPGLTNTSTSVEVYRQCQRRQDFPGNYGPQRQHAEVIRQQTSQSNRSFEQQVRDLVVVADCVSNASEETNRKVQILQVSGYEISQVAYMIHSIAKRTNLLALNATIESKLG